MQEAFFSFSFSDRRLTTDSAAEAPAETGKKKSSIWDSRHDGRLPVGVRSLQTCGRTCSKSFTRLQKCFSLGKAFRLLNFSATPRGLAAMSDGAGLSGIPGAR